MATIKSYTDIEQSKKLAKILPLESADTLHCIDFDGDLLFTVPKQYSGSFRHQPELIIPCWSLATLLGVLPKGTNITTSDDLNKVRYSCWNDYDITYASNPIDACVEMIIRLHELNLL